MCANYKTHHYTIFSILRSLLFLEFINYRSHSEEQHQNSTYMHKIEGLRLTYRCLLSSYKTTPTTSWVADVLHLGATLAP
jgi:hypothetical protein